MPNTGPEAIDSNAVKVVHVVAGIIYNPQQDQILIARRPEHLHMGGYWEFPGGKLLEGETPYEGLQRELFEELGIQVTAAHCYMDIHHDYPDKSVLLEFWKVTAFTGHPQGIEGQKVAWVSLASLNNYTFPLANQTIVDGLLTE